MGDKRWELSGYGLWVIGCILFALVAYDNRDWRSFAASVLFLAGVIAVMVPMTSWGRRGS